MKLDRDRAIELVRASLKQERYEHTLRVTDTALELAASYGADQKKTELAAILHDYAKYRDKDELRRWINTESRLPKDLLDYHHELWHGPVGAVLLNKEAGLEDGEVASAIACHTTGKANMNTLEKVVFLADYIEPGRKFPGVEEVRKTAKEDLDKACLQAAQNTIFFLMSKGQKVYPDTLHNYNDLLQLIKQK
ncbi:bis(5'-nucleosyl)-tetraphosphatase (symmetrical) YqeK [Thalassobacillus devorans]|uniref:bis(5'-nucleosyl)-tetraphosphatase (symmetrical) YqeK n=1 Tax=Thalassobacillus devorans TaxID=279813 RepID=UPI000A1CAB38|nr:bis(5'-nucleosyl)-tetraphosphatase (symmetrical) YqeK [Thalassobacillus devorans]